MQLILPVAGSSSRYPSLRPKWMLTLPNGELLIENCISGFDFINIEKIIVIAQKEHLEKHDMDSNFLLNSLEKKYSKKVQIFVLDNPTISQPMTVYNYLSSLDKDVPFYIKDCDNSFVDKPTNSNAVSYAKLNDLEIVAAANKSYIKINHFNEIEQIQEKEVISDNFCVGGYSFKSSKQFISEYDELEGNSNNSLYVSHIIQKQILSGQRFSATKIKNYVDYGTSKEFFLETRKTVTLFCDFDGVIVKNSSKFSKTPWQYIPIQNNITALKEKLNLSESSTLIITTCRPFSEKDNILKFCKDQQISVREVITDLPHSKRYLINDFSLSNPYPTSVAINIPRNNDNIDDYLKN